MADTSNAIGQGAELVMQQLYQALLGPGVNNLRQGKPATAAELGQSAATIGMNALPLGGAGVAKGAKGINPEGLRALAETMALSRRTFDPVVDYVGQAVRQTQAGSRVYGPGTYFAQNPAASYTRWGGEYGDYMQRAQLSRKAALDIARSKGYVNLDEAGNPSMLQNKTFQDPEIKALQQQGYIGAKSPSDQVVTNWMVGENPGVTTRTVGRLDAEQRWLDPTTAQKITNKMRSAALKGGDSLQRMKTPTQLAKKMALDKAKSIVKKAKPEKPPMESPRG